MTNALTWQDVERITQGQFGRTVKAPCPFCSSSRKPANRRKPVFAVKIKDDGFAIFNCAHCGESGYVHSESTTRVVDLAEIRRRRADAERKEREDKEQRTARALRLWDERETFVHTPAETYLRVTRGIGDWLGAFVRIDESLEYGLDAANECMLRNHS